jgi:hypothetical protein
MKTTTKSPTSDTATAASIKTRTGEFAFIAGLAFEMPATRFRHGAHPKAARGAGFAVPILTGCKQERNQCGTKIPLTDRVNGV